MNIESLNNFKCDWTPGAEKCDQCIKFSRDCGPQLLPKNDRHGRDAISKRRIMQRILFLLRGGVNEDTIMEALNNIPIPPRQQPDHVANDPIVFPEPVEELTLSLPDIFSVDWNESSHFDSNLFPAIHF